MSQPRSVPNRAQIFAGLAAVVLMLGFFSFGATVAHAVAPTTGAHDPKQTSRECTSGDLNDCRVAAVAAEHDEEQGPGYAFFPIFPETATPDRSPALRCYLTQSRASECQPYLNGLELTENVFAEGSEFDEEFAASFLNTRGGETLCWVGTKAWPCSKVLQLPVSPEKLQGGSADEEGDNTEQRFTPSPIGSCPLMPSTPCYRIQHN